MKKLIIVRGISGSGKTTLAIQLSEKHNAPFFEADQFFMHNGHYNFDPNKLGMAHFWCKNAIRTALRQNDVVIVSNTFTTKKELRDYLDFLKNESYTSSLEVEIVEPSTSWKDRPDIAHEKNVHNVPRMVIDKQHNRFAKINQGLYSYADLVDNVLK